jgi:hypothetical protein
MREMGGAAMKRLTIILAVVILPAWVMPARADGVLGLFGRKAKVDPAKRVPELIITLKTEQDERKRASAATELGTFDPLAFPEIVPVLVDILQHDPKTGVRMDAASSLGSLRPVSQVVGESLEKAASSDENLRARLHAKSLLIKYHLAGYSATSGSRTAPAKNSEPPILDVNGKPATPVAAVPTSAQNSGPNVINNASAVKSAPTKPGDSPEFRPSVPRALPQGPTFSTAVPQEPVQITLPPLPMVDGPPLPSTPTNAPSAPAPAPPPPPQAPMSPF